MASLLAQLLSCTSLADPSVAADAAAWASLAGCGAVSAPDLGARQLLSVTVGGGDYCGAPSLDAPDLEPADPVEPATVSHT